MTDQLAGIWNGTEFTIPAGSSVYPVVERKGRLFAMSARKTHRTSTHTKFRLVPTDGNFRSFQYRNTEKGTKFAIALFTKPVKGVIGCIVDFRKVTFDLPF